MKKINNVAVGLFFLLAILGVLISLSIVGQKPKVSEFKSYTSKDLKISFELPKDWYVDEKDFSVLLTSYKTKIGENKQPIDNQLRLDIDRFSGCHSSREENLKDPACGEGGPMKKNQILSKDSKQTKQGATFYKYIVLSSSGNKFTYYLLQKGDKILQISKKPDPSQFDKEFDKIINSIEFK